jgi:hypothetical protein
MSKVDRGPSKDASYQVLIHLAWRFQRRRFFKKSTNQKQEWPEATMFVNSFPSDAIFKSLYSFPDNYLYCSTLFPEGKWLLQHIRE